MITYKIDVLTALKNAGYSTYRMRKDKIMGEATIQQIRQNKPISWDIMNLICSLLNCQPGDLIQFKHDN